MLFRGAHPLDVFGAIRNGPIPRLDRAAPWIPADLASVVHAALERPRESRPPDGMALLQALLGCESLRHHDWMRALVGRYGLRASVTPVPNAEDTGSHLAPPPWSEATPAQMSDPPSGSGTASDLPSGEAAPTTLETPAPRG
jgi:hypothetical protein